MGDNAVDESRRKLEPNAVELVAPRPIEVGGDDVFPLPALPTQAPIAPEITSTETTAEPTPGLEVPRPIEVGGDESFPLPEIAPEPSPTASPAAGLPSLETEPLDVPPPPPAIPYFPAVPASGDDQVLPPFPGADSYEAKKAISELIINPNEAVNQAFPLRNSEVNIDNLLGEQVNVGETGQVSVSVPQANYFSSGRVQLGVERSAATTSAAERFVPPGQEDRFAKNAWETLWKPTRPVTQFERDTGLYDRLVAFKNLPDFLGNDEFWDYAFNKVPVIKDHRFAPNRGGVPSVLLGTLNVIGSIFGTPMAVLADHQLHNSRKVLLSNGATFSDDLSSAYFTDVLTNRVVDAEKYLSLIESTIQGSASLEDLRGRNYLQRVLAPLVLRKYIDSDPNNAIPDGTDVGKLVRNLDFFLRYRQPGLTRTNARDVMNPNLIANFASMGNISPIGTFNDFNGQPFDAGIYGTVQNPQTDRLFGVQIGDSMDELLANRQSEISKSKIFGNLVKQFVLTFQDPTQLVDTFFPGVEAARVAALQGNRLAVQARFHTEIISGLTPASVPALTRLADEAVEAAEEARKVVNQRNELFNFIPTPQRKYTQLEVDKAIALRDEIYSATAFANSTDEIPLGTYSTETVVQWSNTTPVAQLTSAVDSSLDEAFDSADLPSVEDLPVEVRVRDFVDEQVRVLTAEEVVAQADAQINSVIDEILADDPELVQARKDTELVQSFIGDVLPEQEVKLVKPVTVEEATAQPTLPGFVPKGLLTGKELDGAVELQKFYESIFQDADAELSSFYDEIFAPLQIQENSTVRSSADSLATVADDISEAIEVLDSLPPSTTLDKLIELVDEDTSVARLIRSTQEVLARADAAIREQEIRIIEDQKARNLATPTESSLLLPSKPEPAGVLEGTTPVGLLPEGTDNLVSSAEAILGTFYDNINNAKQVLQSAKEKIQPILDTVKKLEQALTSLLIQTKESALLNPTVTNMTKIVTMEHQLGTFGVLSNQSIGDYLDELYENYNIIDFLLDGGVVPPEFLTKEGFIKPSQYVQNMELFRQLPPQYSKYTPELVVPPLPTMSVDELRNVAANVVNRARNPRVGRVVKHLDGLEMWDESIAKSRVAEYIRDVVNKAQINFDGYFTRKQALEQLREAARWLGFKNVQYHDYHSLKQAMTKLADELYTPITTVDITEGVRASGTRDAARIIANPTSPKIVPVTHAKVKTVANRLDVPTDLSIEQTSIEVSSLLREYSNMTPKDWTVDTLRKTLAAFDVPTTTKMRKPELLELMSTTLDNFATSNPGLAPQDTSILYIPSKVGDNLAGLLADQGDLVAYSDEALAVLAARGHMSVDQAATREAVVIAIDGNKAKFKQLTSNKFSVDIRSAVTTSVIPVEEFDNPVRARYAAYIVAMQSFSDVGKTAKNFASQVLLDVGSFIERNTAQVYSQAVRQAKEQFDTIMKTLEEQDRAAATTKNKLLSAMAAPDRGNGAELASIRDLVRRLDAAIEAGDTQAANILSVELEDLRTSTGYNDLSSLSNFNC